MLLSHWLYKVLHSKESHEKNTEGKKMKPRMSIRTIHFSSHNSFTSSIRLWSVIYRFLCPLKQTISETGNNTNNQCFLLRSSSYFQLITCSCSTKPCVRCSEVSVTCTHSVSTHTSLWLNSGVCVGFVCLDPTSGPRSPFREEVEGKSTSAHFIHLYKIFVALILSCCVQDL